MLLERLSRAAIWIAAFLYVAAFLVIAAHRLPYAAELDFVEGVVMDHIARLVDGRPIYVEPSLEFVTLAYMPGYTFASSLLARVFGAEMWVPRAISFGSMCLLALLVGYVIHRETRCRTLAVAGPGLLLASYGVTGGHYDVARPDSMMLVLAFGGLAILRFTSTRRGAVLAAVALTAAFFTKQHASWFALGAIAYLFFSDRRRLVPFAAVVVVGCVGGYFAMSAWLGPWFSFFTWEVPSRWSGLDHFRIVDYVGYRLLGRFGILVAVMLLSLVLPGRPWSGSRSLWAWTGLAAVATGLMATLDPHAFLHVMNPTIVALSILGPIAMLQLLRLLEAMAGAPNSYSSSVGWLLLLAQFVPLYYPAHGMLPPEGSVEARAEMLRLIRSFPGPVMVPYHGDYARSAGKASSLQMIAFDDIMRAHDNRLLRDGAKFIDRMFDPLRAGADRPVIIADGDLADTGWAVSNPWWREIAPSYVQLRPLGMMGERLTPLVGASFCPRFVYVPREREAEFRSRDCAAEKGAGH